jgi:hypothetical protein
MGWSMAVSGESLYNSAYRRAIMEAAVSVTLCLVDRLAWHLGRGESLQELVWKGDLPSSRDQLA